VWTREEECPAPSPPFKEKWVGAAFEARIGRSRQGAAQIMLLRLHCGPGRAPHAVILDNSVKNGPDADDVWPAA
jgi:hypothetical protein